MWTKQRFAGDNENQVYNKYCIGYVVGVWNLLLLCLKDNYPVGNDQTYDLP